MKFRTYSPAIYLFLFLTHFLPRHGIAQQLNKLDEIIPKNIIDSRSKISKSVMGIGASVNVDIVLGVLNSDACSDEVEGQLKVEVMWYNLNDETGKILYNMMKDLKAVEQDKTNFLKGIEDGRKKEFNIGTLLMKSDMRECINELTGPTGKQDFRTEAKYFSFSSERTLKITLNAHIKAEKAESIISMIQSAVSKFEFSLFSSTIATE